MADRPLRQSGMMRIPAQGDALPPGSILDQHGSLYGADFGPPTDPLTDGSKEIARAVYRDIPVQTIPTGIWNIDRVRVAMSAFEQGQFWMTAQLCDALFSDDRVQAVLTSRCGGLFSQPMKHKLRVDSGKARDCRKAWKKAFPKMMPQSVGNEIIRYMTMMSFVIVEILWDYTVTPWQPVLKVWAPHLTYYSIPNKKYVVMTQDGPCYVEPGNGKWMVLTPQGSRSWMHGAIRAIAETWLIKRLAWQSWAQFNTRHGLPVMKAMIPAAGDPTQKVNFISSLRTMGQQAVIGLPQNVDGTKYDVDLMEARDRAYGTFDDTISAVNESITLPILGQSLTTSMPEGGGSYAAARVHGGVRQDIIETDNVVLSEGLYEQVARPFAQFNFDDADLATYSTWDVDPPEDFATRADTLLKVGQGISYLRQAGFTPKNIGKFIGQFGIKTGKLSSVDPVQVEARLAGATGEVDPKAKARLAKLEEQLGRLEQQFARAA